MRKINEIILHCTDTPTDTNVQAIRKYHINVNKWRDIGYHLLVDINGKWYKGRNIIEIGAHCVGHNANSIGIAYIGREPTAKVIEALAHVCNFLISQYDIKKLQDIALITSIKVAQTLRQKILKHSIKFVCYH